MNIKRFLALVLAGLMLCMTLAACGEKEKPDSQAQSTQGAPTAAPTPAPTETTADYSVKLVDPLGNAYNSGLIVKFLLEGQQVAMVKVDENGVATKNLDRANYTLEVMSTDGKTYVYDTALAALTPETIQTTLVLTLPMGTQTTQLYHKETGLTATHVEVGCTQVTLTAGERNYFLFIPQQAGVYRVSVVGEVESMGFYGSPHFMSDTSMIPVENNSFTTTIRADMVSHGTGTDVMVIGIDPGSAGECVLAVERTGDPEWTPEDVAYVIYKGTHTPVSYTLPENAVLKDFDLTASTDTYTLVLDSDGYYHLDSENGPLVLVRLGVDNSYTASFKTMMENTGIRAYFYDENGNFLRREDYYSYLVEYTGRASNRVNPEPVAGAMDADAGVYPLTEDLKYIIQNHGRHSGWFDFESKRCLFRDENDEIMTNINPEIAWLFMCCYIAQ